MSGLQVVQEVRLPLPEVRHLDVVQVAIGYGVDDRNLPFHRHRAACGCFSTSTSRAPRESCRWVAASRSDPNWANASSSRYCARLNRSGPATCFIALIWAFPPTRLTLIPDITAGRTLEEQIRVRKICPSVIEMTLVGMYAETSPA